MTWYPTDYDWTSREIHGSRIGDVSMAKIPFERKGIEDSLTTVQSIRTFEVPFPGGTRTLIEAIYGKATKDGMIIARAADDACQISETLR